MWLFVCVVILVTFFYFTGIKPTNYWEERGVPSLRAWPYLGNLAAAAFKKRAVAYIIDDTYHAFPDRRYCGFYNFAIPALMLRDPELIKRITVKEFDAFPEHKPFLPEEVDPLWSKNLFAMPGGERWQDMRSTLSPSYTSSKMRLMFELMKDCSEQFCKYFSKQDEMTTVELKDAFTRFTNDVIATTAFGVTCDSLENRNNEFYLKGKEITTFSGLRSLLLLVNPISPTLAKILNIPVFSKDVKDFFSNLIKETIKLREEKGIARLDMIHLLMEARKGRLKAEDHNNREVDTGFATAQESERNNSDRKQKPKITDDDIVAQALVFFFAGFDTVSTMMCYTCYELAVHPDIQETLRMEIDDTLERSQGNLTYENLMDMKYLDMVVTETLRKWPPFVLLDRRSVRPITIMSERSNETALNLPRGSVCVIPVYAIHRDPQYYPNPDKFDPERFNEVNKGNINPLTYLPFGKGPRNCIGSRFALLEGKLIIAEIIRKFEIVPVEKTPIPIEIGENNFSPIPDEGFWLGLKPRGK